MDVNIGCKQGHRCPKPRTKTVPSIIREKNMNPVAGRHILMGHFLTLLTSLQRQIRATCGRVVKGCWNVQFFDSQECQRQSVNDKRTADGRLAGLREERRGFALRLSLFWRPLSKQWDAGIVLCFTSVINDMSVYLKVKATWEKFFSQQIYAFFQFFTFMLGDLMLFKTGVMC